MKKIVIIYSGGMDSYTLLHWALRMNAVEIFPISFNYGQKHAKELVYAEHVCKELGLEHKIIDLQCLTPLLSNSALTSAKEIPEGHYAEESMKATVVPGRNLIMLSIAAGYAENINADIILYGAHAGDHDIYPDCRWEFVEALGATIIKGTYSHPILLAPFMSMSKGEIAVMGRDFNLDYSQAWTCYNGREKACGKCGACVERLEAMAEAGIEDPMEYET